MDPRKVKSITNWPRPIDGKAMQRFLGAVNFNREFSAEFANKSAPLEACRLIKGLIEWTDERLTAFNDVKEIFRQDICLRHVDWSATMYLTTDASLIELGAWIGQKDKLGVIRPVICVSRKLTPTQQRWSATKRELYGLMWAMQKLRMYLLGRSFIARVDHKPLVAMMRNPLTAIMEGWVDTINQFSFITEYLPGEENVIADALSQCHEVRLPTIHLCGTTIIPSKQELLEEKSDTTKKVLTTTALDTEQAMQWQ
jgi:hypothetical protein